MAGVGGFPAAVDFAGDSPDGREVGTVRVGKGVNPSAEYIDCCGKSFVKRLRAAANTLEETCLFWRQ